MATDNRLTPLGSVQLFDRTGDSVGTSQGWGWYDILSTRFEEKRKGGVWTPDTPGALEYLPFAGMVCRPRLVLQDTRKARYTLSPANRWEEVRPSTGVPRRYRLRQYDTTANLQWSATSDFSLPENPHCAFSFFFFDNPADHDAATYPPFVRIEFGGANQWAFEFSQENGHRLLRYADGLWQSAADLDEPIAPGGFGMGEVFVFLRHFRRKLFLSTDGGRSYVRYDDGDGQTLVPAGPYRLVGQGGMIVHGLHQLAYTLGMYTSPAKGILGLVSGLPVVSGRYSTPYGTGVTFGDNGMPPSYAKYFTTLIPSTVNTAPFDFHYSPALYAVQVRYPPTIIAGSGDYSEPWANGLLGFSIDKPYELDAATATIDIRQDAATPFTEAHRNRKVRIVGGWQTTAGASVTGTLFTGYITGIAAHQDEFGKAFLRLHLDNVTWRAKSSEWEDFATPLGGLTVNQALDQVLFSCGLTAADRVWHPNGDGVTLDPGAPEDPFLWPREGENKWATMERLAKFAACELGATDDGQFFTYLRNFVDPAVVSTFEANPDAGGGSGDANLGLRRAANSWDYRQTYTGIIVRGEDEWGRPVYASSIDFEAELDATSPRFAGWAQRQHLRLDGTGSQGMANLYCLTEAMERIVLKEEPEIFVPVAPGVSRRDRVRVTGTIPLGMEAGDDYMVVSLKHTWSRPQPRCTTTAGLRKIVA